MFLSMILEKRRVISAIMVVTMIFTTIFGTGFSALRNNSSKLTVVDLDDTQTDTSTEDPSNNKEDTALEDNNDTSETTPTESEAAEEASDSTEITVDGEETETQETTAEVTADEGETEPTEQTEETQNTEETATEEEPVYEFWDFSYAKHFSEISFGGDNDDDEFLRVNTHAEWEDLENSPENGKQNRRVIFHIDLESLYGYNQVLKNENAGLDEKVDTVPYYLYVLDNTQSRVDSDLEFVNEVRVSKTEDASRKVYYDLTHLSDKYTARDFQIVYEIPEGEMHKEFNLEVGIGKFHLDDPEDPESETTLEPLISRDFLFYIYNKDQKSEDVLNRDVYDVNFKLADNDYPEDFAVDFKIEEVIPDYFPSDYIAFNDFNQALYPGETEDKYLTYRYLPQGTYKVTLTPNYDDYESLEETLYLAGQEEDHYFNIQKKTQPITIQLKGDERMTSRIIDLHLIDTTTQAVFTMDHDVETNSYTAELPYGEYQINVSYNDMTTLPRFSVLLDGIEVDPFNMPIEVNESSLLPLTIEYIVHEDEATEEPVEEPTEGNEGAVIVLNEDDLQQTEEESEPPADEETPANNQEESTTKDEEESPAKDEEADAEQNTEETVPEEQSSTEGQPATEEQQESEEKPVEAEEIKLDEIVDDEKTDTTEEEQNEKVQESENTQDKQVNSFDVPVLNTEDTKTAAEYDAENQPGNVALNSKDANQSLSNASDDVWSFSGAQTQGDLVVGRLKPCAYYSTNAYLDLDNTYLVFELLLKYKNSKNNQHVYIGVLNNNIGVKYVSGSSNLDPKITVEDGRVTLTDNSGRNIKYYGQDYLNWTSTVYLDSNQVLTIRSPMIGKERTQFYKFYVPVSRIQEEYNLNLKLTIGKYTAQKNMVVTRRLVPRYGKIRLTINKGDYQGSGVPKVTLNETGEVLTASESEDGNSWIYTQDNLEPRAYHITVETPSDMEIVYKDGTTGNPHKTIIEKEVIADQITQANLEVKQKNNTGKKLIRFSVTPDLYIEGNHTYSGENIPPEAIDDYSIVFVPVFDENPVGLVYKDFGKQPRQSMEMDLGKYTVEVKSKKGIFYTVEPGKIEVGNGIDTSTQFTVRRIPAGEGARVLVEVSAKNLMNDPIDFPENSSVSVVSVNDDNQPIGTPQTQKLVSETNEYRFNLDKAGRYMVRINFPDNAGYRLVDGEDTNQFINVDEAKDYQINFNLLGNDTKVGENTIGIYDLQSKMPIQNGIISIAEVDVNDPSGSGKTIHESVLVNQGSNKNKVTLGSFEQGHVYKITVPEITDQNGLKYASRTVTFIYDQDKRNVDIYLKRAKDSTGNGILKYELSGKLSESQKKQVGFIVTDEKDNTFVDYFSTTPKHKVAPGTYTVAVDQKTLPSGLFAVPNPQIIEITENGEESAAFEITDKAVSNPVVLDLNVGVVESGTQNSELPPDGTKVTLVNESGIAVVPEQELHEGHARFENLTQGIYRVEFLKVASPYTVPKADKTLVTIPEKAQEVSARFNLIKETEEPGSLKLSFYAASNGKSIYKNLHVDLTNKQNGVVTRLVPDTHGIISLSSLSRGDYSYVVGTPDNYYLQEEQPFEFTLNEENECYVKEHPLFYSEDDIGTLVISVVQKNGNAEIPARYIPVRISKPDGKVVIPSIKTGYDGKVTIRPIPTGTYVVEAITSAGMKSESDQKEYIVKPGTQTNAKITLIPAEGRGVIQARVFKRSASDTFTGEPLAGIPVQIKTADGKVVETLISGKDGFVISKAYPVGQTYTLAINLESFKDIVVTPKEITGVKPKTDWAWPEVSEDNYKNLQRTEFPYFEIQSTDYHDAGNGGVLTISGNLIGDRIDWTVEFEKEAPPAGTKRTPIVTIKVPKANQINPTNLKLQIKDENGDVVSQDPVKLNGDFVYRNGYFVFKDDRIDDMNQYGSGKYTYSYTFSTDRISSDDIETYYIDAEVSLNTTNHDEKIDPVSARGEIGNLDGSNFVVTLDGTGQQSAPDSTSWEWVSTLTSEYRGKINGVLEYDFYFPENDESQTFTQDPQIELYRLIDDSGDEPKYEKIENVEGVQIIHDTEKNTMKVIYPVSPAKKGPFSNKLVFKFDNVAINGEKVSDLFRMNGTVAFKEKLEDEPIKEAEATASANIITLLGNNSETNIINCDNQNNFRKHKVVITGEPTLDGKGIRWKVRLTNISKSGFLDGQALGLFNAGLKINLGEGLLLPGEDELRKQSANAGEEYSLSDYSYDTLVENIDFNTVGKSSPYADRDGVINRSDEKSFVIDIDSYKKDGVPVHPMQQYEYDKLFPSNNYTLDQLKEINRQLGYIKPGKKNRKNKYKMIRRDLLGNEYEFAWGNFDVAINDWTSEKFNRLAVSEYLILDFYTAFDPAKLGQEKYEITVDSALWGTERGAGSTILNNILYDYNTRKVLNEQRHDNGRAVHDRDLYICSGETKLAIEKAPFNSDVSPCEVGDSSAGSALTNAKYVKDDDGSLMIEWEVQIGNYQKSVLDNSDFSLEVDATVHTTNDENQTALGPVQDIQILYADVDRDKVDAVATSSNAVKITANKVGRRFAPVIRFRTPVLTQADGQSLVPATKYTMDISLKKLNSSKELDRCSTYLNGLFKKFKINKNWVNIYSNQKHPEVNFDLYRYNDDSKATERVATISNDVNSKKELEEIYFSDYYPVFNNNGTRYAYTVYERSIDNFEQQLTKDSVDGTVWRAVNRMIDTFEQEEDPTKYTTDPEEGKFPTDYRQDGPDVRNAFTAKDNNKVDSPNNENDPMSNLNKYKVEYGDSRIGKSAQQTDRPGFFDMMLTVEGASKSDFSETDIVLVVDNSNSLNDCYAGYNKDTNKVTSLKRALIRLENEILNLKGARLGVVNFTTLTQPLTNRRLHLNNEYPYPKMYYGTPTDPQNNSYYLPLANRERKQTDIAAYKAILAELKEIEENFPRNPGESDKAYRDRKDKALWQKYSAMAGLLPSDVRDANMTVTWMNAGVNGNEKLGKVNMGADKDGMTNIAAGLDQGVKTLYDPETTSPDRKKIMIVITDGAPTAHLKLKHYPLDTKLSLEENLQENGNPRNTVQTKFYPYREYVMKDPHWKYTMATNRIDFPRSGYNLAYTTEEGFVIKDNALPTLAVADYLKAKHKDMEIYTIAVDPGGAYSEFPGSASYMESVGRGITTDPIHNYFEARNHDQLINVIEGITHSAVTDSIKNGTITDPMGDLIELQLNELQKDKEKWNELMTTGKTKAVLATKEDRSDGDLYIRDKEGRYLYRDDNGNVRVSALEGDALNATGLETKTLKAEKHFDAKTYSYKGTDTLTVRLRRDNYGSTYIYQYKDDGGNWLSNVGKDGRLIHVFANPYSFGGYYATSYDENNASQIITNNRGVFVDKDGNVDYLDKNSNYHWAPIQTVFEQPTTPLNENMEAYILRDATTGKYTIQITGLDVGNREMVTVRYNIRLEEEHPTYIGDFYYQANKETTLIPRDGKDSDGIVRYFPIPSVKGPQQSFKVVKTWENVNGHDLTAEQMRNLKDIKIRMYRHHTKGFYEVMEGKPINQRELKFVGDKELVYEFTLGNNDTEETEETNKWAKTFSGLPVWDEEGELYFYTFEEVSDDDFDSTIEYSVPYYHYSKKFGTVISATRSDPNNESGILRNFFTVFDGEIKIFEHEGDCTYSSGPEGRVGIYSATIDNKFNPGIKLSKVDALTYRNSHADYFKAHNSKHLNPDFDFSDQSLANAKFNVYESSLNNTTTDLAKALKQATVNASGYLLDDFKAFINIYNLLQDKYDNYENVRALIDSGKLVLHTFQRPSTSDSTKTFNASSIIIDKDFLDDMKEISTYYQKKGYTKISDFKVVRRQINLTRGVAIDRMIITNFISRIRAIVTSKPADVPEKLKKGDFLSQRFQIEPNYDPNVLNPYYQRKYVASQLYVMNPLEKDGVQLTGTSDENGNIVVDNVGRGIFTLKEIVVPGDGEYDGNIGQVHTVYIPVDGTADYYPANTGGEAYHVENLMKPGLALPKRSSSDLENKYSLTGGLFYLTIEKSYYDNLAPEVQAQIPLYTQNNEKAKLKLRKPNHAGGYDTKDVYIVTYKPVSNVEEIVTGEVGSLQYEVGMPGYHLKNSWILFESEKLPTVTSHGSLIPIEYYVVEVKAPDGFKEPTENVAGTTYYNKYQEVVYTQVDYHSKKVPYQLEYFHECDGTLVSAIINEPKKEPKTEIRLIKKDSQNDNLFLEGAEFTLIDLNMLDSSSILDIAKTIGVSSEEGVLKFENLTAGKYLLQETKAPSGYVLTRDMVYIDIPGTLNSKNELEVNTTIIRADIDGIKKVLTDQNKPHEDTDAYAIIPELVNKAKAHALGDFAPYFSIVGSDPESNVSVNQGETVGVEITYYNDLIELPATGGLGFTVWSLLVGLLFLSFAALVLRRNRLVWEGGGYR